MTDRTAWGHGLATVADDGTVLDTWYPSPALGTLPADVAPPVALAAGAGRDQARGVRVEPVVTVVDLDTPPTSTTDAYLRLHLLSHRLVLPNTINLDGVFFGLREAIPLLEASKGAVVVTSSMAGLMPLPGNPVYAATKWALIGLVRSVHGELEGRGIRINALCPGAVATPLMGEDPREFFDSLGLPSFEPEVLAGTVVEMLASDRSGQAILHRPPGDPEVFEFARLPEH